MAKKEWNNPKMAGTTKSEMEYKPKRGLVERFFDWLFKDIHHPVNSWQPNVDTTSKHPPFCYSDKKHGVPLMRKPPPPPSPYKNSRGWTVNDNSHDTPPPQDSGTGAKEEVTITIRFS